MIKVAHILPVNCIGESMPRQRYEMYLTHKVLEHPDLFSFLAKDRSKGIGSFKILDNSACELGEGLDFAKVLKAAEIIDANEIVLPDIPRSGKSLSKTLSYLAGLSDSARKRFSIAAVAQGESLEQVLSCIDQILSLHSIDTIMIPKWYCVMNNSNGLGRHKITEYAIKRMRETNHILNIHWLGLDTGARELITPLNEIVRSVDTGYYAALSTPQWSSLDAFAERPRQLTIDLESMPVDINRWNELRRNLKRVMEEM